MNADSDGDPDADSGAGSDGDADGGADPALIDDLLAGKHRALARVITKIENRAPGYRDLVSALHQHTGHADVIGITGSPGAGKSTLVDKMAETYRDRGLTVGVIAIDPSSPFTGGAVLGDRIRMASNTGDMDVFFRSMSARGRLGGLSTATTDAVKALDAFGKDKIIIETVGAGQNEVDIVRTADTVVVLVPPGSGDDVQMLKAGILEIADLFVVNKADLPGADRTVQELTEMVQLRGDSISLGGGGHHGPDAGGHAGHPGHDDPHGNGSDAHGGDSDAHGGGAHGGDGTADSTHESGVDADDEWVPPIVETVANTGEGVADLLEVLGDHLEYLDRTGELEGKARSRYAAEIRTLLREDANDLLADELEARGGIEGFVDAVMARERDPYDIVDEVMTPIEDCVRESRDAGE